MCAWDPAAYHENAAFVATLGRPVVDLLPTGMAGWLRTFASPFFGRLAEEARAGALEEAVALLRPALCDERGRWTADYVRLRFAATR